MIRIAPASRLAALTQGFMLAFVAVAALAAPVNVNTADAATIARELKGIGLKRAQAIVDYRTKYGPFRSADELALVKGIGAKAIERNRADIRVDVRKTPGPAGAAGPSARKPQQTQ